LGGSVSPSFEKFRLLGQMLFKAGDATVVIEDNQGIDPPRVILKKKEKFLAEVAVQFGADSPSCPLRFGALKKTFLFRRWSFALANFRPIDDGADNKLAGIIGNPLHRGKRDASLGPKKKRN